MPSFDIQGVSTVVIQVRNVEVSKVFYKDTLGLSEDFADGGMVWLSIGAGEHATPLLLHPTEQPEPVANGLTIEISVDNVDAVIEAIRTSKGRVVQEPVDREWGVREAVIEDPDAYRIWIVQSIS
ncbi:VOC family protein [Tuberibacillus sp. Marseille-P3662]|uniref:VOC family protein n=1 Tax=Tuberibacillus sp. Marseille-P3662 TaxID=1965358 RepID=UPI0015937CA3|nr:VOC family protein [Tuberibacillus sp. Marseille-P3662]